MQAIEYERRRLGKTDLQVPVLGIGGAQLGRRGGSHDEQLGVDTVLAALAAGIDLIDTSAAYIGGESERYIGIALQEWYRRGNRREDLIIESKAGSRQRPHDYSYDAIMASTELSLRALQTDYLDVMLVHDPAEIEPVLAPHAAHEALLDLKKQGVIRHLGLGCRPHAHHQACIATGDFEVSLTFRDYNLIERSALAGVLEPAVAADVGVFNASIMLSGLLGGDDPIGVAASAAGVSPDRLEMTDELRRAKRSVRLVRRTRSGSARRQPALLPARDALRIGPAGLLHAGAGRPEHRRLPAGRRSGGLGRAGTGLPRTSREEGESDR